MRLAHIVPECALCTIDDIATMVGSVPFAKSTCNTLITASIHAASWLILAMFDAQSSSLSKFEQDAWLHQRHLLSEKQNIPEPFAVA
jgi:hypothetical protein